MVQSSSNFDKLTILIFPKNITLHKISTAFGKTLFTNTWDSEKFLEFFLL